MKSQRNNNDDDVYLCSDCGKDLRSETEAIGCDGRGCKRWYHPTCLQDENVNATEKWFCTKCRSLLETNIRLGTLSGEDEIGEVLDGIYKEIISWRKNCFLVPNRGKAGKDLIEEITRLINFYNFDTHWKNLSLKLAMIFLPLMLQKPSPKSKPHQNTKFLSKRLKWWEDGDLTSIMNENRAIQKKLQSKVKKDEESNSKAFCRLMLVGKIRKAVKFIDNDDNAADGIHPLNPDTMKSLQEKHPKAGPIKPEVLLDDQNTAPPEPVIYEALDADYIISAAKGIDGSGGPTNIDAEIWRHMICSKFHQKESEALAQAIAELTKSLCRDEVKPQLLTEFLAGRLIPLKKNPQGIRPIGVGEVLRRITAKAVTRFLKQDIQVAAGTLQTCSGIQAGIEAAVHAMKSIFDEEGTEATLLIDATNAFNSMNRVVALHNIKVLCPTFHRFLANSYQCPLRLYVCSGNNSTPPQCILSEEGATQGDPAAMAMYSISSKPLIDMIKDSQSQTTHPVKQAWYADDGTASGTIESLKQMWDYINEVGPGFGYFPNAGKTVLIVKGLQNLPKARVLFGNTKVNISTEGERHLGAAIGSTAFRDQYVNSKVEGWVKDVEELALIGTEEPQLALSAYIHKRCVSSLVICAKNSRWNQ